MRKWISYQVRFSLKCPHILSQVPHFTQGKLWIWMKYNSNLYRKWFRYLVTHNPGLCPDTQSSTGNKVLRVNKWPNKETILLSCLKRRPEASLLWLWARKIGCSFCFWVYTQLLEDIPNLTGRGPACWGPRAREGENTPLQWSSVFSGLSQAQHISGAAGCPSVCLKAICPGHSFQE